MVGRFPFASPNSNEIDNNPSKVSDLGRRMIAKVRLEDTTDGANFWNEDFPRMSTRSLLPEACDDQLLAGFLKHAGAIDAAMERICRS